MSVVELADFRNKFLSVVERLVSELRMWGCPGTADDREITALTLQSQGFSCLMDLDGASPFNQIECFNALPTPCLDFLNDARSQAGAVRVPCKRMASATCVVDLTQQVDLPVRRESRRATARESMIDSVIQHIRAFKLSQ